MNSAQQKQNFTCLIGISLKEIGFAIAAAVLIGNSVNESCLFVNEKCILLNTYTISLISLDFRYKELLLQLPLQSF